MTLKRTLEEYIRGWLPKEPYQPETKMTRANAVRKWTNPFLRISGILFPCLGIVLILFVMYRFLIQLFKPAFAVPGIQIISATGFTLLVSGMVLRTRSVISNVNSFKSTNFNAGLTMLTVGVLGIAFNTLLRLNSPFFTFPWYGYDLFAAVIFSLISFGGWLLLLRGRLAWIKSIRLSRKSFSILSVGCVTNLIIAPIQVLLAFNQSWYRYISPAGTNPLFNIALIAFLLAVPLGIIFSVYGWAAVFSRSMKRHRLILLIILAIFFALVLASLLI